jgi:hypothetical protein
MKKLLIVIALMVSAVSFSNAQGGGQMGTPAERAQRSADGPAYASLNLSADQKTKLVGLLTAQNKSTDSLRATLPQSDDRMAMMQALRPKLAPIATANEAKFISWLTPEQKATYDAAVKARPEGAMFGQGGRPRN